MTSARTEARVAVLAPKSEPGVPITWERMVEILNKDIETDPRTILIVDGSETHEGILTAILLTGPKLVMLSSNLDIEPIKIWHLNMRVPTLFSNGSFFFTTGKVSYTILP